jgi:hypothetical protein
MAEKVIFEWRASGEEQKMGTGYRCQVPGMRVHLSPSFGCGVHSISGWNSHQMKETLDFFQSMYKDLYEDESGDA